MKLIVKRKRVPRAPIHKVTRAFKNKKKYSRKIKHKKVIACR